jgi:2'-5' RNA ligase
MRLFLAIPAAGEAQANLATAIVRWRRAMPEVKWEAPEALHLTLQFIGEWAAARVPELAAAFGALAWEPVRLRAAGTGAFPEIGEPRLLWAGVSAPPELGRAVDAIGARLERLGIAREARPFTPHITVGRLPRRERAGAWKRTWASPAPLWGEWVAVGFGLYESLLQAPPAERYRLRHWFG